jgi:hypothetical protein
MLLPLQRIGWHSCGIFYAKTAELIRRIRRWNGHTVKKEQSTVLAAAMSLCSIIYQGRKRPRLSIAVLATIVFDIAICITY